MSKGRAKGARVAGMILAAGESTRMGEPKALLDWDGKALLQHQIDELSAAGCDPVIVVIGHKADELRARVRCATPCRMVENAAYRSGRASSVRAGAEAVPDDAAGVVIASVDQPCRRETVRALIDRGRSDRATIVVPRHEGKNGHPALFAGSLLGELRGVDEEHEGLRAVRRGHRESTVFVDVDDALVTLNLNTSVDYTAARERFGT